MTTPLLDDAQASLVAFAQTTPGSILLGLALVLSAGIVVAKLLNVLFAFYKYFLRGGKVSTKLGEWAVVTGCTDGIGKDYAFAFAKKGFKVVLVSRNEEKLTAVAQEIEAKYKTQSKIITADFSKSDTATWKKISEGLSGLNVGVLVNNAGLSYDHAEWLDQISPQLVDDLAQVNIIALTKMCQVVLPGMKERKRGAIVNIGSGSGIFEASPLTSVYGATKAYVDVFSKSLAYEYKKYGITVQNQIPLYVATKMSKIRRARLDAPTPAVWVRSAINHIGYEISCTPYWVHALMMWVLKDVLPQKQVANIILSHHLDLHKRWKKKQEALRKAQ